MTANTDGVPVALQVSELTKLYGVRKALNNISFTLPSGAFVSVFGSNGAGKSTLLRIIATLVRPTQGTIAVFGTDLKEQPEQVRAHIGLISHKSMLYDDLSAEENLMLFAQLYGVTNAKARVSELLAAVELTVRRHDLVGGFSRGMTQRLSIARALINDPQLLLLDEPYTGLDPHATAILDELITSFKDQRTVLMVSHDLDKGRALATHTMTLESGKLKAFEVLP